MDTTTLRIGDAERERVAALLREHVGAGRLDIAEFERRVGAVYAARTHGELAVTTADLPAVRPAPATSTTGTAGRQTLLRYVAWGPLISTALICMAVWTMTSLASGHPLYFWPMWVIGPWAAVFLGGGGVVGSRCPISFRSAPRR